jgi:hypothetical protein
MLSREEWLPLARKLALDYTYVREDQVLHRAGYHSAGKVNTRFGEKTRPL